MGIIGLIKKHINARLRSLETVEIVIVESVDLSTWTCSVRPKARVDVRGDVQDMPQILDVPISVQKAGDSVILLPPKVGDIGICVFSKYALDNILINSDTVEITIPRMFDINDCIYIAGVYTEVETVPTVLDGELLIHHHTGSHIKFDNGGNLEIKANRIDLNEL